MIQPNSGPPFITLSKDLQQALIEIGGALPAWDMAGTFLADATLKRYRAQMESVPLVKETVASLRAMLKAADTGYAVVRLDNVAQALGNEDQYLRLTTAILAEVAVPFQPIQRFSLWKPIGTNLNGNPGMTSGTGYQGLHIDLVNATRPPDYTALLCIRPDPLGAGASILSDARAAASRLTPSSRVLLAEAAYSYGKFFELSDVGEEYSPFPILDGEPAERGFVRFTAKMVTARTMGEAHARAAQEFLDELIAGQVSFTLQRGDFLIVNQHRRVHGREPLGPGQHDVAPEDRRLLLQLFGRDTAAC